MAGLLTPAERKARQEAKRLSALRFLNQPLYSTPEILGQAMGLKTSAGWYRTLHQLEQEGLLTAGEVDLHGQPIRLWGITSHGQAMAHAWLGLPLTYRSFQPSKVGLTTLRHLLGLQRLQLQAEAAGWSEWTYTDFLDYHGNEAGQYRPDATARTAKGRRVAIEFERTLKTPKRYREILATQIRALTGEKLEAIIFVCQDQSTLQCLERYIRDVKDIPDPGSRRTIAVDPGWLNKIYFRALASFPESKSA